MTDRRPGLLRCCGLSLLCVRTAGHFSPLRGLGHVSDASHEVPQAGFSSLGAMDVTCGLGDSLSSGSVLCTVRSSAASASHTDHQTRLQMLPAGLVESRGSGECARSSGRGPIAAASSRPGPILGLRGRLSPKKPARSVPPPASPLTVCRQWVSQGPQDVGPALGVGPRAGMQTPDFEKATA